MATVALLQRKVCATGLALLGAVSILVIGIRRRFPRNVKYEHGFPLLGIIPGVLKAFFKYEFHDHLHARFQRSGMTWAANFAGVGILGTIDPKNIEYMLKSNFDNYVKGKITEATHDLLGGGIFNVDGEKWLHQRKTASKMFTKRQFEGHIWQVVQANIQKLADILRNTTGQEVCLFNLFNRFTLDTIGEIGFSRSIGSLQDPTSPFLKSFDAAQSAMVKRGFVSQTFPVYKALRALGLLWERDLPHHLQVLREYSDSIVEDLISKVATNEDNSFVGLFIKDSEGQELLRRDANSFRLYMRDMVLNFLIAGRDTTAQNLTYAMFELSQHPEAMAKAREEVARVCGNKPVVYQDITKLHYCKAVIDEALRLHPSVPFEIKVAVAADTLPDGTWVPAGCRLCYIPYAQGRCTELWGADATSFRPDRWMEMPRRPSSFEFVAFNAGKRECLGKRLAEVEMTATIATLVRDFDFSLAIAPAEVRYDIQLTLGCSSGLPAVVSPRCFGDAFS